MDFEKTSLRMLAEACKGVVSVGWFGVYVRCLLVRVYGSALLPVLPEEGLDLSDTSQGPSTRGLGAWLEIIVRRI